jgi:hypothetical protein
MNPMEDYVAGRYPENDRRNPPEASLLTTLREATEELQRWREQRDHDIEARAAVRARLEAVESNVAAIRGELAPLTKAMTKFEGGWRMLGILIAVVGGMATAVGAGLAAFAWLKAHILAGSIPGARP